MHLLLELELAEAAGALSFDGSTELLNVIHGESTP
jgi:hypothetical protein